MTMMKWMTFTNTDFEQILNNQELKEYIKQNTGDLWQGTPIQGYRALDSKQKGSYGEKFVCQLLRSRGFNVIGGNNNSASYDAIVNKFKTEIKFSVAQTNKNVKTGLYSLIKDRFSINHIGIQKDWDRLLIVCINPNFEESHIKWYDKSDIVSIINDNRYFRPQQGGVKAQNDDYMSMGKKALNLIYAPFAKSLSEW